MPCWIVWVKSVYIYTFLWVTISTFFVMIYIHLWHVFWFISPFAVQTKDPTNFLIKNTTPTISHCSSKLVFNISKFVSYVYLFKKHHKTKIELHNSFVLITKNVYFHTYLARTWCNDLIKARKRLIIICLNVDLLFIKGGTGQPTILSVIFVRQTGNLNVKNV